MFSSGQKRQMSWNGGDDDLFDIDSDEHDSLLRPSSRSTRPHHVSVSSTSSPRSTSTSTSLSLFTSDPLCCNHCTSPIAQYQIYRRIGMIWCILLVITLLTCITSYHLLAYTIIPSLYFLTLSLFFLSTSLCIILIFTSYSLFTSYIHQYYHVYPHHQYVHEEEENSGSNTPITEISTSASANGRRTYIARFELDPTSIPTRSTPFSSSTPISYLARHLLSHIHTSLPSRISSIITHHLTTLRLELDTTQGWIHLMYTCLFFLIPMHTIPILMLYQHSLYIHHIQLHWSRTYSSIYFNGSSDMIASRHTFNVSLMYGIISSMLCVICMIWCIITIRKMRGMSVVNKHFYLWSIGAAGFYGSLLIAVSSYTHYHRQHIPLSRDESSLLHMLGGTMMMMCVVALFRMGIRFMSWYIYFQNILHVTHGIISLLCFMGITSVTFQMMIRSLRAKQYCETHEEFSIYGQLYSTAEDDTPDKFALSVELKSGVLTVICGCAAVYMFCLLFLSLFFSDIIDRTSHIDTIVERQSTILRDVSSSQRSSYQPQQTRKKQRRSIEQPVVTTPTSVQSGHNSIQ